MARRFFSSVMVSLSKVFRKEIKPRPVIQQFLTLGGEALLIIAVCALLVAITAFKTLVKLPLLQTFVSAHPSIFTSLSQAVSVFPYVLLFFAVTICYRIGSGTRPRIEIAAASSCGTTLTFFAFQKLMYLFINVNKYNIIYGALSGIIVLLMEVFFFFLIFLFFAQFLFVYQFFDTLILSQLYILPQRDDTSFLASLKRLLFIRPDALLHKEVYVKTFERGEYLYKEGESGDTAYYLARGTVAISRPNNISYIERGGFFGEEACLLDKTRHESARALTEIRVLIIPQEKFFALLDRNPLVSRKALSKISRYFSDALQSK